MEVLNTIFTVCIIVGFTMPILNLVFGFFSGIDADIDVDTSFDVDTSMDVQTGVDAGHGSIVGLNFMSFMLAITIFGLLGKFLIFHIHVILAVFIAVTAGFIAYFLMFRFVFLPLKKNREIIRTHEMEDLIGKPGVLILQITSESCGTVQTTDSMGASITYMATAEIEELKRFDNCIKKGSEVGIVDVNPKKRLCTIRVLDF